jgi:type II secretory pathway pseudopilin PulG
MMIQDTDDRGDTLVEIVLALVIIGLVVGAFFGAYATASTGSKTQRDLVTADGVLRSYAELTKDSVRRQCVGAATTYTVTYSLPAPAATWPPLSPPPGSPQRCPSSATTTEHVTLRVTMPNGVARSLTLYVRKP